MTGVGGKVESGAPPVDLSQIDRDKVTGRALFATDASLEGMLFGGVLRSPFPHARILRLDVSRALQIEGVHAIVTAADLPSLEQRSGVGEVHEDDIQAQAINTLAHTKALYEGHALAAVAASDMRTVHQALAVMDVEFAVLPHVTDVRQAMEPEAPLLHEQLIARGVSAPGTSQSNIASRYEIGHGDINAAFAAAEVRVGDEFTTSPVSRSTLSLPGCLAHWVTTDRVKLWVATSHCEAVRAQCARILDLADGNIEIQSLSSDVLIEEALTGLEPIAIMLSRKAGLPVKMQMTREEAFRISPYVSGSYTTLRAAATREGRVLGAEGILCLQAGAFPGAPVQAACQSAFAAYELSNYRVIGYDVVSNRGRSSHSPASGAAIAAYAVESMLDMLAQKLDMDPIVLRTRNLHPDHSSVLTHLLHTASQHSHYLAPLASNQGRGVALVSQPVGGDDGADTAAAIHICDVEVDAETGEVKIVRYSAVYSGPTLAQHDAVRMQGEIARGLGWALMEAYTYDDDGRLLNPDFLDYRLPTAADLPAIDVFACDFGDPVTPEVTVRLAIAPTLAAVANAVGRALGARSYELPLSPPQVLRMAKAAAWRRRR